MRQGMESDPFIASNQNMPSGMEGELIEVKPGLRLAVVNCHPQDDLRIEFETDEVPLEFSFYLAGRASYAISHGQGENKFQSRPGLNTVAAFPHSRGTMEIPAQAEARMVAIHIERHVLLEYFADLPRVDVPELGQAMDNGAFPYCFRHAAMQPSMSVAAHQILTCPYHGLARKIFYESKTLELIALQFGSLMEGVPVPLAQPPLNRRERMCMEKAREILLANLQSPPSLFQLADSVGLTHTKLNKGFRELWGTTVFGYLRLQRLEQARQMLDEAELNIAEIAFAAGFSSPSHFAKAFLSQYGVQPGAYRKQYRASRSRFCG